MDHSFDRTRKWSTRVRRVLLAPLKVATRRQTYYNLAYLITAFPLGLLYFPCLVICFSVGVGTSIAGVGVLLLIAALLAVWGFATFERELAMWWLDVRIAPMATPAPTDATLWNRFRRLIRNPVMWKSLVYLLLKFLFGVFSFTSVVIVFAFSVSLILSPIEYLSGLALALQNSPAIHPTLGIESGIDFTRLDFPLVLAATVVLSMLGVLLLMSALHAFNGLAFAWGQFARLMLGMSDNAQQLAEARAIAARERTRAQRADQSRRELIVNVSHELRTPIANISGHVEALLMADAQSISEEDARRYLEIVAREVARLSSLIDDLLALARADADELKLDVRPISAGDVVEEVYQSLAPLAKRDRQVKVVRSITPELPLALADRDRLAQVLLNLVRNAITHTPAGGIVSVSLALADDGSLVILVADTGIGISHDELEHIFDRFYRTDASRARASGGFGLGLSIVRDLLQAMGGAVSVTSTPGEGSQFRVILRAA